MAVAQSDVRLDFLLFHMFSTHLCASWSSGSGESVDDDGAETGLAAGDPEIGPPAKCGGRDAVEPPRRCCCCLPSDAALSGLLKLLPLLLRCEDGLGDEYKALG